MTNKCVYDGEGSLLMAERLRDLREEKKKTRFDVTDDLQRLGVGLSEASLERYEQADRRKHGAYSNDGMRVGTLRALADYYRVTTDYLLGLSDYRNVETERMTVGSLGLAERSAENLERIMKDDQKGTILDRWLSSEWSDRLLLAIACFKTGSLAWLTIMHVRAYELPIDVLEVKDELVQAIVDAYKNYCTNPEHPTSKFIQAVGGFDPVNPLRYDATIALNGFLDDIFEEIKSQAADIVKRSAQQNGEQVHTRPDLR